MSKSFEQIEKEMEALRAELRAELAEARTEIDKAREQMAAMARPEPTTTSAAPEIQAAPLPCSPLDSQLGQQILEAIRLEMRKQGSGTLQIRWKQFPGGTLVLCGSPGSLAPEEKLPPFLRTDRENPH